MEIRGDRSTKAGCSRPDTALSSAERAKRSSDSSSLGWIGARKTCRDENAPVAGIQVATFTTCEENVAGRWNEFARTRFSKYGVVNREMVEIEGIQCGIAGPLEPFPRQAADEMVPSEMEDVGV